MSTRRTGACYGGVEAGGTKFVCAIGSGPRDLRASAEFPTRDPVSTIRDVTEFFRSNRESGVRIEALGIGSFGPLELDREATAYGRITTTPKPGWRNVDVVGELSDAVGVPVEIETDVNVAALGESVWGAARGLAHFLYVTVGTGLGVGAIVNRRVLRGRHHPEMGHMLIPLNPKESADFTGTCPFHGTCAEGLASGTSIVERWGRELRELPREHPAWTLEADYLADFFTNLTFALQPEKIIVGGGVANDELLSMIRARLPGCLAGYRADLASPEGLQDYVSMAELGARAGVLGAIELARRATHSPAS